MFFSMVLLPLLSFFPHTKHFYGIVLHNFKYLEMKRVSFPYIFRPTQNFRRASVKCLRENNSFVFFRHNCFELSQIFIQRIEHFLLSLSNKRRKKKEEKRGNIFNSFPFYFASSHLFSHLFLSKENYFHFNLRSVPIQ